MQRIFKDLPHLFKKALRRDLGKHRDILRRVLHMDVDPARVGFVFCRRGFHDGVENGLLPRKMVIKRRGLDAHSGGDLSHADGIIALGGKQLQRLVQDLLLRIFPLCLFPFHWHPSLTNTR